jgi:hypothetical protein
MQLEQYRDIKSWLSEFIGYLPEADISTRAASAMKRHGIFLPAILTVLRNGDVTWADRDHSGCIFEIHGSDCDGTEFTIYGRFEAGSLCVAIDDVSR